MNPLQEFEEFVEDFLVHVVEQQQHPTINDVEMSQKERECLQLRVECHYVDPNQNKILQRDQQLKERFHLFEQHVV